MHDTYVKDIGREGRDTAGQQEAFRLVLFVPSAVEDTVLSMKVRDLAVEQGIGLSIFVWDRRREIVTSARDTPNGQYPLLRIRAAGLPRKALGYLLWMIQVFRAGIRLSPPDLAVCLNLPTAFPMALASLKRGVRFIFLDGDNVSLSYRWPPGMKAVVRRMEAFTARRATLHVVPGSSRWRRPDVNLRIVSNSPSARIVARAREISHRKGYSRPETFTLYVNGWLTSGRGLAAILAAARALDQSTRILVAGRPGCPEAEELIRLPNVDYFGPLSLEDALALYERCHLVLTFYDPSVEINRLAEPSKWHDCIAMATPFVTNQGIQTVEPYLKHGACFVVPYGNVEELVSLINRLDANRKECESAGQRVAEMPSDPWEERMKVILGLASQ